MNYKTYSPSVELNDIVKEYVVFNSFENIENVLFLPNGGSFIVFNRGIKANARLIGIEEIFNIPSSYSVSYKTNRIKQIYLSSEDEYNDEFYPFIVVELLPLGYYKLFNTDMSSMDFKYQEIEKDIVDKYFSQLYMNGNIEDEVNYLNQSLIKLKNIHKNHNLEIEVVIDKIYTDYNLEVNIENLLEEFKYSRSTLERHFKKMLGLTPKQFIYISKFCKTLIEYIGEKRTFHELQYIYSDNSYMNSVFKKFLGIAPSEILKRVIDGKVAIYQLLSLEIDYINNSKDDKVINPLEVLKYSKNIKVLYVEDDKDLSQVTARLLENYFDDLTISYNGKDGLDKYLDAYKLNNVYDLVISDINMPEMDGMEMSREILKINPNQIIIITSAHYEFITGVKEVGVREIITKPFNNEELTTKIFKVSKEIYLNKHQV